MNSSRSSLSAGQIDPSRLPVHVAVIMDGNGRWAKKRMLNRIKGHEKGADAVRTIVHTCRELHIPYLTLYAFSTENWQRPEIEVAAVMRLLEKFLQSEQKDLIKNGIRLNALGQKDRLPESVQQALEKTGDLTRHNQAMHLNLALSYGGRAEIIRMVQKIAAKARSQDIHPDDISHDLVADYLYTKDMPDPDLLIRTSGEMRISNFLLWQIAYAELYFTETLWPDFGRDEFLDILKDFQHRNRRFGKTDDQTAASRD